MKYTYTYSISNDDIITRMPMREYGAIDLKVTSEVKSLSPTMILKNVGSAIDSYLFQSKQNAKQSGLIHDTRLRILK